MVLERVQTRLCSQWQLCRACTPQVGGTLAALHEHIAAARAHESLGAAVDYKLAPSAGPRSAQAAAESGFNTLYVALCKVGLLCPCAGAHGGTGQEPARHNQRCSQLLRRSCSKHSKTSFWNPTRRWPSASVESLLTLREPCLAARVLRLHPLLLSRGGAFPFATLAGPGAPAAALMRRAWLSLYPAHSCRKQVTVGGTATPTRCSQVTR